MQHAPLPNVTPPLPVHCNSVAICFTNNTIQSMSQDVPSTKGFSSQLAGPESATRTFDGMTLIEFAGCPPSTRIMLPVKGKGMACGFQATPMVRACMA